MEQTNIFSQTTAGSIKRFNYTEYLCHVLSRWDEEDVDTKSYFEFRINVIELTGDVILEITDYAYPDEKRDSIDLWNRQISSLRQRLGA